LKSREKDDAKEKARKKILTLVWSQKRKEKRTVGKGGVEKAGQLTSRWGEKKKKKDKEEKMHLSRRKGGPGEERQYRSRAKETIRQGINEVKQKNKPCGTGKNK